MTAITDAQILTIATAIVFPPAMLIYSNSRISEAKQTLHTGMAAGFARIETAIQHLAHKLEIHELEHHK